jgi:hypothetical protein
LLLCRNQNPFAPWAQRHPALHCAHLRGPTLLPPRWGTSSSSGGRKAVIFITRTMYGIRCLGPSP